MEPLSRAAACSAALAFCLAGFVTNASAAPISISLIGAGTGTDTLTFKGANPPTANPGGCTGADGGGAGFGHCLQVVLTSDVPFFTATTTIGWSAADSGIQTSPSPRSAIECTLANCDTAVGRFGGLGPTNIAAGIYTIGSMSLDLTSVASGTRDLLVYARAGVDGVANELGTLLPHTLNRAVIVNDLLEPGTASLLGLGFAGLHSADRRHHC